MSLIMFYACLCVIVRVIKVIKDGSSKTWMEQNPSAAHAVARFSRSKQSPSPKSSQNRREN